MKVDATKKADVEAIIAAALETFGVTIAILVNKAGG